MRSRTVADKVPPSRLVVPQKWLPPPVRGWDL
jgi:hypothetical protein